MITASQLRAARALVNMDQRQLAELAGLSLPTIQRMEASDGVVRGTVDSLTKLLTAFGYQDIDFGQRPEFSKRYLLRGQDEMAIRQAFNDQLLSFFETYQGTSVDAGNNQLFVFRASYRCQPQEAQNQLALALNILNLLPRY